MTSLAAALAAHTAFTSKVAAIDAVINLLQDDHVITGHMIDRDSNTAYVSTCATYIGHWSCGYDDNTAARIKRITTAFGAAGLRHHSTGHDPRGVRLAFRVA
jgi:hypothetical protein